MRRTINLNMNKRWNFIVAVLLLENDKITIKSDVFIGTRKMKANINDCFVTFLAVVIL